MRYDRFGLDEAEGCVLVHSLRLVGGRLAKGKVLAAEDIGVLRAEGIREVTALRLDPGDVLEDEAATLIGAALPLEHMRRSEAATGRVNFHATVNGLFTASRETIDALNRIDPAITLATLADHAPVQAGDMVATVKIIPLAVREEALRKAEGLLRSEVAFRLKPFRPHKVVLIATELSSLKTSVMDRTAMNLKRRLEPSGSVLLEEIRIPHDEAQLARALERAMSASDRPDLMIVFGASAVSDPHDVIPAALLAAGGEVEHVGMPVDPGNLLVLGGIGSVPVLGAPGCARSPRENGFDWVLNRILARERPTSFDITGMGVGGLLMEISGRPRPRETVARPQTEIRVGGLLLAAGQARRMGQNGPHKLLAEFDGRPLVRRMAETLVASKANPAVAITGHRRDEIEAALDGVRLPSVFNKDYACGLASSLVCGFTSPELASCDGILVMLADMPALTTGHLDQLVDAFRSANGQAIVRASHQGKRGNPIILPRATFEAVRRLEGDVGARAIIESSGLPIIDVDIGPSAHLDVDTAEAVVAAGGVLKE